jgi:hypothetical protein
MILKQRQFIFPAAGLADKIQQRPAGNDKANGRQGGNEMKGIIRHLVRDGVRLIKTRQSHPQHKYRSDDHPLGHGMIEEPVETLEKGAPPGWPPFPEFRAMTMF